MVLPVLEGNSLQAPATRSAITEALRALAPGGAPLALEADLPAPELAAFLEGIGSEAPLGVCYDVGNATSFGFEPKEELAELGSRVLEVHFKDRWRGGASASLGEAETDFPAVLAHLKESGFSGPIVLETPAAPDWRALAEANLAFLDQLWGAA